MLTQKFHELLQLNPRGIIIQIKIELNEEQILAKASGDFGQMS